MATDPIASPLPTCAVCGAVGPVWDLRLHKNIGIVLMHIRSWNDLRVCRSCLHKEYWKRFGVLVTIGWTSYYSIFIGPALLVLNTARYVKALASQPTALPAADDARVYLPPPSPPAA